MGRQTVFFAWRVTEMLRTHFNTELSGTADLVMPPENGDAPFESLVGDAEIIVGWAITESLLTAAPRARLVIVPAIGVTHQVQVIRQFPGVTLVNSHGNAVTAAQHALALLLAVTNRIPLYHNRMTAGQWRAFMEEPPSMLLNGKTIGLLGTGTIGTTFARLAAGFPVSFTACSRTGRPIPEFPQIPVVPVTDLHGFLARIDILIIGVPSTSETRGLIDAEALTHLRPGAVLVNVARGDVVEETALFDALRSGRLDSAGLDVWYNYRPEEIGGKRYPYTLPFHELDNVVMSPHRGGSPLVRTERFDDVVDTIRRWCAGLPLRNIVDLTLGY